VIHRDDEGVRARGPGWEEHRNERSEAQTRWYARASQFAALDLALDVFGRGASVETLGWPGRPPLVGGLVLRVPFRNLADHQAREARFLSLVALDPVLSSAAIVFVVEPRPLSMASAS